MKYILSVPLLLMLLSACFDAKEQKTTIEIVDNHRHYYPLLRGQELDIMFEIKNTGKSQLTLSDILTSCGCITLGKSSVKSIPPGRSGRLLLKYDSSKNIGYVKHHITLYGNFTTSEKEEIVFDVNVVPEALYTKDYEEVYREENLKSGGLRDFVEGRENNRRYYVDE